MSVIVKLALIQSEDRDACKKLNDQFRSQPQTFLMSKVPLRILELHILHQSSP